MHALVFMFALASTTAAAETCPEGYGRFDAGTGVLGCERPVARSSYREYLVLTHLRASPDRVVEVVWQRILDSVVGGLKRRDFISRSPRRIVFYDQIKTPVVSDRDYTCEATKVDGSNGRREVRYVSRNDLGPPPDPHHTRIPYLRAAWIADPDGQGGTRLTYVTYSEPGGSVPAWMVRGAQSKHAMTDVDDLRKALGER